MLNWFKTKARQKALKNILELLDSLVELSDKAYKDIQRFGDSMPSDRQRIHSLQESLFIQLGGGPLPFDRVKTDFIEPLLSRPEVSEGARLAIEHICKEVVTQNLSWSDEDYAAYDKLFRTIGKNF